MKDAVIVSTARTPIGRAFRGALNDIKSPTLMGHAIRHAVSRAKIDGAEVDDVIMGTVLAAGTAGMNLARNAAFAAGLPATTSAQTIDRQCSSGLMAIATARQADPASTDMTVDCRRRGGVHLRWCRRRFQMGDLDRSEDPWLVAHMKPDIYMPMLQTAEVVAARNTAFRAKARTPTPCLPSSARRRAQAEGRLRRGDRAAQERHGESQGQGDEGEEKSIEVDASSATKAIAPRRRWKARSSLKPAFSGGQSIETGRYITAGNASQLSDGASASVHHGGAARLEKARP
jgi:acetyl-CoA C-acetyltransferase